MRKAWLMWAVGVGAYIVAVMQRTSFGVAGLAAAERFDATATTLAGFVVLQLVVYTGLQLPVGVLVDRFGARVLVVGGALLMAVGQLLLAVAPSIALAMTGRVAVGVGDAMTFICVLRVIPAWFPSSRAALLTQLTGLVGQLGQVLSAVPLAAVLATYGWRPAFASAATLSILTAVVVAAVLQDGPPGSRTVDSPSTSTITTAANLGRDVAAVIRHPGVQLGFWAHFVTMFSNMTFGVMWGFPFLESAQGRELAFASTMMSLLVITSAVASPFAGVLVGRYPQRRTAFVLGVALATAAAWALVLSWPGHAPTWVLVVLVLILATGGPGSMIGFDFARTFSPARRLGTATGLVNIGGFTASLVAILAIGAVLDLPLAGTEPLSTERFRIAMLVQVPLWGLGVWGVVSSDRRLRRQQQGDLAIAATTR